jgi:peptide/nickel transport system permease protein
MVVDNTISVNFMETPPRVSEWRRIIRVFLQRKIVLFGLIIIVINIIIAIFAPLIAPHDPYRVDMHHALLLPSKEYLLGTDEVGRDVLSRIIFGSRVSLMVGVGAVSIGAAVGMTMGLIAGYYGGTINAIIMRLIDGIMSFPGVLLSLVIASLLGVGLKNVIIALSVGALSGYARLMCAQVLSVKENDYIMAMHAIGASNRRIMLHHIVPNCFPPLIVLVTMMLGMTILAEAGLSFLGVGVEPPIASWGGMVSEGRQFLLDQPLLSLMPGFMIMLVVFGFNMVGDGLRDALDPKLRGIF